MPAWEREARLAVARYRGHVDWEDLLAVALLAAWRAPDHAFIAAERAAKQYLRSPMNRTRLHNRDGKPLPELVPWEAPGLREVVAGEDPAQVVVGRLWCQWLLGHPSLTEREQEVLSLWVLTGDSLTSISRRRGMSAHWGSEIYRSARRKLREVATGGYVPRHKP